MQRFCFLLLKSGGSRRRVSECCRRLFGGLSWQAFDSQEVLLLPCLGSPCQPHLLFRRAGLKRREELVQGGVRQSEEEASSYSHLFEVAAKLLSPFMIVGLQELISTSRVLNRGCRRLSG